MGTIDERIVKLSFDNKGFESGIQKTLQSLDALNKALEKTDNRQAAKELSKSMNDINKILKNNNLGNLDKLLNKQSGFSKITEGVTKLGSSIFNAFKKLDFTGIGSKLSSMFRGSHEGASALASGVDAISAKFSNLQVVAATALANITNRMVNAGIAMAKSLTIDPITTGLSEYELKMNSIQTILTNTSHNGTTLDQVNKALAELNTYADKTIYNFGQMTDNIGKFTAAGVDLDTSVASIKGIANLAAASGSTSAQASTAMYQLSQALAAGKVSLMDWNSVVNAGMGGELFQNALKQTAKEMGIYVSKSKPFRETLKDDWLTTEVLTKTLQKFAEDESLIKAATEVKTFTQLLDTMKESVGSGWATSWEYIIGDKDQATEFFTAVSDGFNRLIQPSTDARNSMLKFWNEHGGRSAVIEGLTNVMASFQKVMRGIGMAWDMVFPPMTGQKLVDLSNKFKDLTEKFKITDQMAGKIGAVFKGLFDAMLLVKDGVVGIVSGFSPLIGVFKKIFSSAFEGMVSFGRGISNLREYISEVGAFNIISSQLQKATTAVADFVLKVGGYIASLAGKIKLLNFSGFAKSIGGVFDGLSNVVSSFFERFNGVIGKLKLGDFFAIFNTFGAASSNL